MTGNGRPPAAAPPAAPPVPLASATVLLLRDGPDGLEVFMVVRHHQVDFASGALVFPGGKVDKADTAVALRGRSAGTATLADAALAVRVAALREAFEECGVLLARPRGEIGLVTAARLAELDGRWRQAIERRQTTILDMLESEDLELAGDLLVPFAHWITPVALPKRFDTHFFLAAAPDDQLAVHDGRESVDSRWVSPRRVLAEAEAGQATVVFATRMNLEKLAASGSVAEAMDAARTSRIVTVLPELVDTPDGAVLRIPLEAGYGVGEVPARGLPRP